MPLGWIDPDDYSFQCLLLLERFQIQLMLLHGGWRVDRTEWRLALGTALNAHPAVKEYLALRCPECSGLVEKIAAAAPAARDRSALRDAEKLVLLGVEDFVVYTTPHKMADHCDFIRGWSKERLFALADFAGKTVLDVGAGSGRLSFAAAEKAAWVYASEPVGTLREYLRDRAAAECVGNLRVLDGFAMALPFPDRTFDLVMSGHVMGEDCGAETAEFARVCKPGGWLLDCPGDSERGMSLDGAKTSLGWEPVHYVGSFGKDVFCYRKRVT